MERRQQIFSLHWELLKEPSTLRRWQQAESSSLTSTDLDALGWGWPSRCRKASVGVKPTNLSSRGQDSFRLRAKSWRTYIGNFQPHHRPTSNFKPSVFANITQVLAATKMTARQYRHHRIFQHDTAHPSECHRGAIVAHSRAFILYENEAGRRLPYSTVFLLMIIQKHWPSEPSDVMGRVGGYTVPVVSAHIQSITTGRFFTYPAFIGEWWRPGRNPVTHIRFRLCGNVRISSSTLL